MSNKSRKDIRVNLRRMIDACVKIREYISSVSHETFLQSGMEFDAICMQLTHLGEQADKIMKDADGRDLVLRYDAVPWNELIRQRGKLSHWYEKMIPSLVWDTVSNDVPVLERNLKGIMTAEFGECRE